MTLYKLKVWMAAALSALTFSSCGQTHAVEAMSEPEPEEIPLPERFSDEPPVVDPTVRYQLPVDTRIALSGNYGELRPNHFHAGLDFKTDQTTGHPVYCFADGHVRRAAINAYGYGLVLYVEHPALGLTTVYAHLEAFDDAIWQKIRERQVAEHLNNADINFAPDELPVSRGQVIARSGNTGSSGGPHVHFEMRNIPDDDDDICYDPQMYFLRELADTKAPRISHVYLYPQPGQGVVNGKTTRQVSPVTGRCATTGGRGGALSQPFTAWGRVGLGLKAYDYMDGQSNKYGVKELRLKMQLPTLEGQEPEYRLLFHFRQDAFRYSESRYTNSLTDYAAWMGQKSMIMKSFIEPGNFLQQIDATLGDGMIDIDEERLYHFVYELEDAHGNLTTLAFDIRGEQQPLPELPATPQGCVRVHALEPLLIDTAGCRFQAQAGSFYVDQDLAFAVKDTAVVTRKQMREYRNKKGKLIRTEEDVREIVTCVSPVYTLGNRLQPIHNWCTLSIQLPDTILDESSLYLTNLDKGGVLRHSRYVPASADGPACMMAEIREGGRYAVMSDAQKPKLSIVSGGWRQMQIDVKDEDSGVRSFEVMIDGKFVPFDMDNKGRYYGHPCHYGITQGIDHRVEMWAEDYCGNRTSLVKNMRF